MTLKHCALQSLSHQQSRTTQKHSNSERTKTGKSEICEFFTQHLQLLVFFFNPHVRTVFRAQCSGQKWLRQFYGGLGILVCGRLPTKFLVLGGDISGFGGGGGSANFSFMGAGIFLILGGGVLSNFSSV